VFGEPELREEGFSECCPRPMASQRNMRPPAFPETGASRYPAPTSTVGSWQNSIEVPGTEQRSEAL